MTTRVDAERLRRLLGGDDLSDLRIRLRRWLEGPARGQRVMQVEPRERRALEGLLGQRSGAGRSMTLKLAALDAALSRAGVAPDLHTALGCLDGPLADRAAQRERVARQWNTVCDQPRTAMLDTWLNDKQAQGLVKRLSGRQPADAARLLDKAARVIDALPAGGAPLGRLAAQQLGDAHALDSGRPVATLVLAVLRAETGSPERARDAWAGAGVLVNELSKPVLILNLPCDENTPTGALATDAARVGEPLHLSLRLLVAHRPVWRVDGRRVHVCENPTVVAQAAASLRDTSAPLVCTDGMPSASQRRLLAQLHEAGARLHYHGDFDWPGIRIGNFVIEHFKARPWRFGQQDYDAAPVSDLPLSSQPAIPSWDSGLAASMRQRGTAVHEEAVLETLLDDLKPNRERI